MFSFQTISRNRRLEEGRGSAEDREDHNGQVKTAFSLIAALATSLLVLGHAFSWNFAKAYFGYLGAQWIAGRLSWGDRYSLCDEYLWIVVAALLFFPTGLLFHGFPTMDEFRQKDWISPSLILVPGATVVGLFASYLSGELFFARQLAMIFFMEILVGIVLLSLLMFVWWLERAAEKVWKGAIGLFLLISLSAMIAPHHFGRISAAVVRAKPFESLNRISLRDGEMEERWYLVQATADWLYLGRTTEADYFESFKQVKPDAVEILPLAGSTAKP